MEAFRCKDCGDTRWSFRGFGAHAPTRCELCNGDMVPERRSPSHAPLQAPAERRDAVETDQPAAG